MAAETYLVTGGAGFLGAPLVQALLQRGCKVRVFDNLSRGSLSRLEGVRSEIELINGDIRNGDAVAAACRGVDSVCHLAFLNGTRFFYEKPAYVLDVGVKGIINVLDGCLKHGVKELIVASSSEVYQTPPEVPTDESVPLSIPDPLNPRYSYGGGKIISELMALNYGREGFQRVVIFRPHNVFGPNMGWEHVIPQFVMRLAATSAPAGETLPFQIQGDGTQTRAFIYIDDFTAGLMRVIDQGLHLNIYNIGTMQEIRIREVAERVAECMGKIISIVPGPQAAGGTMRRCPDVRKLAALGFQPQWKFDQALKTTVDWYRSQPFL